MPRKKIKKPILSKRDREMFAPWQQDAIIRLVKMVRQLDKKKNRSHMPLVWKNGEQIEGTTAEFVAQLRGVASRCDERFSIMSDETGLLGDFIRRAADEIERLSH